MRFSFFALIMVLCSLQLLAQEEFSTVYLDQSFKEVRKGKALYVKEYTPIDDTTMSVKISFLDGSIKMEGDFAFMKGDLVENGSFTFYHHNGTIESQGDYVYGYKSGEWKRYAKDGAELQPRYYSADMGERLRLHILSKIVE